MKAIAKYTNQRSWNTALFGCLALTFLVFPVGTAPPLIGVGLLVVMWFGSRGFFLIPATVKETWFRPVILFVILPWIGLTYSLDLNLGMDYAMKTKYWLLVFVTAACAMDDTRVFTLATALWTGLLMGVLLAAVQVMGWMDMIKPGFPGFGIVYTQLGMYLNIGILMAAFYFKRIEKTWGKAALLVLILGFIFHLAVLKGRSGYLIFLLISPVVANDLMHKFSWKVKALFCCLLIAALCLTPSFTDRIETTYNGLMANKDKIERGEVVEAYPRFYILRGSLDAIKDSPVLGIGTGSIMKFSRPKGYSITHSHNDFLYMGTSFGIIGFIACFWMYWNLFYISWQTRRSPLGYFVLSTGFVLFIGGLFDTQILNTGTLVMLTMTYGFLHHLSFEISKEKGMGG